MRHMSGHASRGQVVLDFMVSYGIAILIIILAVYVFLRLDIFGKSVVSQTCTPTPGFLCDPDSLLLASSGNLSMVLTQYTNGPMNVTGVACASAQNVSGDFPATGNIHVTNMPQFYPIPYLGNGKVIYSGNSTLITAKCYGASGIASSSVGSSFSGIIWINYTYFGLPKSVHTIQAVATFTAQYG